MNALLFLLQDPSDVVEAAGDASKEAGQWLYGAGLAGTFAVLIFVAFVFYLLWRKAQTRIDEYTNEQPVKLKALVKEMSDGHAEELREKNQVIKDLAQQLRACHEGRLTDSQQVGETRVNEVSRVESAIINNTTAMRTVQDSLQPLDEILRKIQELWDWHHATDASGSRPWYCKGDPEAVARAVRLEARRRESDEYRRRRADTERRPPDNPQ